MNDPRQQKPSPLWLGFLMLAGLTVMAFSAGLWVWGISPRVVPQKEAPLVKGETRIPGPGVQMPEIPIKPEIKSSDKEILDPEILEERAPTVLFPIDGKPLSGNGRNPLAETVNPLHETLRKKLFSKLESAEYQAWIKRPNQLQDCPVFPQETEIKDLRSQLAREAFPPDGTAVIRVPVIPGVSVTVDGVLKEEEWRRFATRLQIGQDGKRVVLLLMSDGEKLFLACDAIDERTPDGFDQFRFYLHPTTTYSIRNERILVRENQATSIRETGLKWRRFGHGSAGGPIDQFLQRRYVINDWNIYHLARGTASFKQHKHYEASLDLEESGLGVDLPFAAWVEVESDPLVDARGKFRKRVLIGLRGSQEQPLWFILQKPAAEKE